MLGKNPLGLLTLRRSSLLDPQPKTTAISQMSKSTKSSDTNRQSLWTKIIALIHEVRQPSKRLKGRALQYSSPNHVGTFALAVRHPHPMSVPNGLSQSCSIFSRAISDATWGNSINPSLNPSVSSKDTNRPSLTHFEPD